MRDDDFVFWIIAVPVIFAIAVATYFWLYQECLETGLSPEQCRFIVRIRG